MNASSFTHSWEQSDMPQGIFGGRRTRTDGTLTINSFFVNEMSAYHLAHCPALLPRLIHHESSLSCTRSRYQGFGIHNILKFACKRSMIHLEMWIRVCSDSELTRAQKSKRSQYSKWTQNSKELKTQMDWQLTRSQNSKRTQDHWVRFVFWARALSAFQSWVHFEFSAHRSCEFILCSALEWVPSFALAVRFEFQWAYNCCSVMSISFIECWYQIQFVTAFEWAVSALPRYPIIIIITKERWLFLQRRFTYGHPLEALCFPLNQVTHGLTLGQKISRRLWTSLNGNHA